MAQPAPAGSPVDPLRDSLTAAPQGAPAIAVDPPQSALGRLLSAIVQLAAAARAR